MIITILHAILFWTKKNWSAAEYQGRKKRKTTNALYLTDRQGLPLAISILWLATTTTSMKQKFNLK